MFIQTILSWFPSCLATETYLIHSNDKVFEWNWDPYADNAIYSDPNESSAGTADAQGYPSDYLQSVGYENGPSPPKGKNSIIVVDEEILGSHY